MAEGVSEAGTLLGFGLGFQRQEDNAIHGEFAETRSAEVQSRYGQTLGPDDLVEVVGAVFADDLGGFIPTQDILLSPTEAVSSPSG